MDVRMNENAVDMFIIEGCIQALRKAKGKLNLVSDIQDGAWLTGIAAGLADQSGLLANSASLALYEGEEVEHIAMLVNNRLAVGTFEWLGSLEVGDNVKLVVTEMDDGLIVVRAILRKDDQLLWMPYSVADTRIARKIDAMMDFAYLMLACVIIFFLYFAIRNDPFPKTEDIRDLVAVLLIVNSFVVFMAARGMMHLGKQAEDIYFILDIPYHEKFKIAPFSLLLSGVGGDDDYLKKGCIFDFAKALRHHKKRFGLSE